MKIHFFVSTTFPEGMAATRRIKCYAKGLISNGNAVSIYICHKYYTREDEDNIPQSGIYNSIYYNYICGKFKSSNPIKRRWDWYIGDYLTTFIYALKNTHRGDAIFVYLYPLILQILLIIVAKIKHIPIVKETCEHPAALGNINSKLHQLCNWFEFNVIMLLYDGFIPISNELNNFVVKYKRKSAKSIIIPILVEDNDTIDFSQIPSPFNVPYIIHTGTMLEQKDSISKIIYAFAKFKKKYHSNLKLVFTGPHANEHCQYLPLMEELDVREDIELLGLVSHEQIAILQHFASMSIIYKSDNIQTRNCFPTKLGEMLISGIPVITTTIGDASVYLENSKSAYLIEPDNGDSIVFYINEILTNRACAKKIGEAGREVAKKYFNPIYQGKRLSDFYKNLK